MSQLTMIEETAPPPMRPQREFLAGFFARMLYGDRYVKQSERRVAEQLADAAIANVVETRRMFDVAAKAWR